MGTKKLQIIMILLCSMVLVMPMVHATSQSPKQVEKWFQKFSHKKEKLTKLHFYFHDTQSGKNPTAVMVAQANMTLRSPSLFGAIMVIDDPLRVGPERNSTLVGRAQGIYGSADIEQMSLLMSMNYVFTDGEYKGSTLSVLGRNPVMELYRELSIIGGTGVFRLARGIVTAKTHWVNVSTGDAIVEHSVMVTHY